METITNGGPAFPEVRKVARKTGEKTRLQRVPGMSLRDHFAGSVLPQLVYDSAEFECDDVFARAAGLAREAYIYADAMLAERAKVQS